MARAIPHKSAVVQVALHGGAPNKNIGDAFLLVWKFPKACTVEDIARVMLVPDTKEHEASVADAILLLTCFLVVADMCLLIFSQHHKIHVHICYRGPTL